MENLKKEREQLRRNFNKTCKELDLALTDKSVIKEQVLASIRQLEDKSARLFSLDEHIRENLFSSNLSEEDIEKELDEVEMFRDALINYRTRYEVCMIEKTKQEDEMIHSQSSNGDKNKRKFRLPKLEMKKFDGNVRNWIGFWGQFKKIHDDEEIELEDKFQYLLQATEEGTVARDLIDSFPPSGSNYLKAIDQMKARFARDEFLIEVYVRELLDLVLKQATKTQTGMSLSSLYDKIETQLRALESLGVTSDKYAAMLFPLVESTLPDELLRIWERNRSTYSMNTSKLGQQGESNVTNSKNTNLLSMLLDFMRREVEAEERINLAQTSFSGEKSQSKNSRVVRGKQQKEGDSEIYTASALYSATGKGHNSKTIGGGKITPICLFCEKPHASHDCLKAQALTLEERRAKVTGKRACFSCLKINHTSRNCRALIKCLICKKKHYPIMCADLPDLQKETLSNKIIENRVDNVLTTNFCTDTLLQTILVRLVNNNKEKIVRALLDSASQKSYILSKCVRDLEYVKISEQTIIQGVFGGLQITPQKHGVYDVVVQNLNRNFEFNLRVLEQNKICNQIPRLENSAYIQYLKKKNIILNEIDVENAPREVELLLGADIFGRLLTGNIENLDDKLIAIETQLGWTIMGQLNNYSNRTTFSGVTNCSLTDLWNLDILGIKDPAEVKSKDAVEEETIKYFNDNIKINEDGRYEVHLPWIEGHSELSSNENLAETRLQSTTKKLLTLNKFEEYEKVLVEWENLGIIEQVRNDEKIGKNDLHFLPHHAVFKELSKTTKVRPVFDASAKDKQGNSLNNCLQTGPNLIELIPSLLLRFRLGLIGVTADIEKAFLQISISPDDRNFLRFFWWSDYTQRKMMIYRHCRVVFGVKPSPFLLAATINYHLLHAPETLQKTAGKLKNSFYVDNCITSVNTCEELNKFVEESKQLMAHGKFNLREWVVSSETYSEEKYTSVLGMVWNFKEDVIFCDLNALSKLQTPPRTRRGLLSAAQSIFDPIGFTCPFTLIPKLLLQETWNLKVGWDSELPEEVVKRFERWLKEINFLNFCSIPRSVSMKKYFDIKESSLHIFSDSSKSAFATCVFLRMKIEGIYSVQLIQSKSRIAPKNITIPRLELLACLIGVRLYQSIQLIQEFSNLPSFFEVILRWH